MRDLEEIREEIDGIDSEIRRLYLQRLALAADVAEYKIVHKKPVYDREREEAKLAVLSEGIDDDYAREGIRELYQQIMSTSRKRQYRLLASGGEAFESGFDEVESLPTEGAHIVFQGVEGAYSQVAMNAFFDNPSDSYHVETWREAMEALISGDADYAVLPIENSTAGAVTQNYDLLAEYDVAIVGEQIIEAAHCLLGLPGAAADCIKTVYSHPQALMQCDKYLRTVHPDYNAVAVENTAVAAEKVRRDGDITQAAIAGRINADIHGLIVLDEAIQDEKNNRTRFIIVSARKLYISGASRISLCFELPHEKGTLYQALSHFIFNGINMTRIESRPIAGKQWEYRFFIDIDGGLYDMGVRNAIVGLQSETSGLRILGNY